MQKRRFWDHPRRCGENLLRLYTVRQQFGSPPQVRGKRYRTRTTLVNPRITPAGAGKTGDGKSFANSGQDHPRRCGENRTTKTPHPYNKGSPPRMRGKRFGFARRRRPVRITPADAGKTPTADGSAAAIADHPRGCGENKMEKRNAHGCGGSPPRMRGKPPSTQMEKLAFGITPADAGKTPLIPP